MKMFKKLSKVILLICLSLALSVSALATDAKRISLEPTRFVNINDYLCDVTVEDGNAIAEATLSSHTSQKLSITLKVSTPGVSTKTYQVSKKGDFLMFDKDVPIDNNKSYSFTFIFKAGSESYTKTIKV